MSDVTTEVETLRAQLEEAKRERDYWHAQTLLATKSEEEAEEKLEKAREVVRSTHIRPSKRLEQLDVLLAPPAEPVQTPECGFVCKCGIKNSSHGDGTCIDSCDLPRGHEGQHEHCGHKLRTEPAKTPETWPASCALEWLDKYGPEPLRTEGARCRNNPSVECDGCAPGDCDKPLKQEEPDRVRKAFDLLVAHAFGGTPHLRSFASIPPRPDHDADLVVAAALDERDDLLQMNESQAKVIARYQRKVERLEKALRLAQGLADDVQGPREGKPDEWRIPWSRYAVEVFSEIAAALALEAPGEKESRDG